MYKFISKNAINGLLCDYDSQIYCKSLSKSSVFNGTNKASFWKVLGI